ncbi:MAG TPA: hypothetical protein PKA06_14075, partial [Gemmatales bacterium]|nr:hypothetical protein [Gemmatales bacterium]
MTGAIDPRSRPGSKIDAPKDKYVWKVHAVDLDNGKELWQKTIHSGVPQQPIHPSNTYATETPATDGKAVYAYFGATGTLVALNFEGEE